MEFRFRAGDDREPSFLSSPPPAPPPSDGYFTVQAMRAGFTSFGGPMHPKPSLEALQRELQEERIKEEIIARKIAQRRMLEEQVRREMEIERAMVMERFQAERFCEPTAEPLMLLAPEGMVGERFGPHVVPREVDFDERERFGPHLVRREVEFEKRVPLQESAMIKVEKKLPLPEIKCEVKTSSETGPKLKEGKRTFKPKFPPIFVDGHVPQELPRRRGNVDGYATKINPSKMKLSGTKRKIVSAFSGTGKFPRPAQKEWSCALCQVSATSEEGLNDHLKGKKHQAKAAQLGANKKSVPAVKNCSSSTALKPRAVPSNSKQKAATGKGKGLPLTTCGVKKVSIQVDGKLYQVVEKRRYLWCGLCRVKCNSTAMMVSHLSGRRHSLEESRKEKKPEVVNREAVEKKEVVEEEKKEDVGEAVEKKEVVKEEKKEDVWPSSQVA